MFLLTNQYLNTVNSSGKSVAYCATVSNGVDSEFAQSIFSTISEIKNISDVIASAVDSFENVIVLKDKSADIPEEYFSTQEKFNKYAQDAYGFVSKDDSAIVIVQDNHMRKDVELEGDLYSQGADTIAHEIGHLVDDELSTTNAFKQAYLADLKAIEQMLQTPDAEIFGKNLREMIFYLKHYVEGVNFEDGISEDDIVRAGLRENFAECFSTLVDSNPSKINQIFSTLFCNTMAQTASLIV